MKETGFVNIDRVLTVRSPIGGRRKLVRIVLPSLLLWTILCEGHKSNPTIDRCTGSLLSHRSYRWVPRVNLVFEMVFHYENVILFCFFVFFKVFWDARGVT